jgi:hypothetical protein
MSSRRFVYLFPFPFALQGEQGVGQRLVALRLAAQFAVALPALGGERPVGQRAFTAHPGSPVCEQSR